MTATADQAKKVGGVQVTHPMVTKIKLRLSNAYLVQGQRPILVDTGSSGEADKIVKALARAGLTPADLGLILHTHVHSDHVGSTTTLLEAVDVPMAYHRADQPLAEQGHNGKLQGIGLRGQMMAAVFSNNRFTLPQASFFLEDGLHLDSYGVAGRIVHTPGHTVGSISLLLDGGEAIVGDVLMGGELGGNLLPGRPSLHYFAQDPDQVRRSLDLILEQAVHTLYVGHGGPLAVDSVRARASRLWPRGQGETSARSA